MEKIAKETPPVDNAASRFGNPAFRTFYDKISEVGVVFCRYSCCAQISLAIWCPYQYIAEPTGREHIGDFNVFQRSMGQPHEDRLWEWNGAQFPVLAVSFF